MKKCLKKPKNISHIKPYKNSLNHNENLVKNDLINNPIQEEIKLEYINKIKKIEKQKSIILHDLEELF